jgi:hypothetical protein
VGVYALSDAISAATALTSLSLQSNRLFPQSCRALHYAVNSSRLMRRLDVRGICFAFIGRNHSHVFIAFQPHVLCLLLGNDLCVFGLYHLGFPFEDPVQEDPLSTNVLDNGGQMSSQWRTRHKTK